MKPPLIALSGMFLLLSLSSGQEKPVAINALDAKQTNILKNSIDFCPEYPIVDVYALQYARAFTAKDEMMLGVAYLNQKYDCGHSNAGGLILGYRRYFWRRLHMEYQIWPIYDNFYEKTENKHYKNFDMWNEFRVGYGFDFIFLKCPCYINVQWPFGFGLYGSNKPDSFKDENSGNKKYFYFPPLVFIGIRF